MFGNYQNNAVCPVDDLQVELSQQFINPHAQSFEKAFYALREVLDELWLSGQSSLLDKERRQFLLVQIEKHKRMLRVVNPSYPLGRCYNITHIVYAYLHAFELKEQQSVFYPLQKFIASGGVFKIIWGEVRHEVFQTSLQIGNWYFDVANDTVFIEKPKVLKFTFDSTNNEFHEVNSIQQYVAIKRSYHECEIYINSLFPVLAPLFPLLVLNQNGKFELDGSQHVADLMMLSRFEFLDENTLPRLPRTKETELRHKLLQQALAGMEKWFSECEGKKDSYSSKELGEAVKAVRLINFSFIT